MSTPEGSTDNFSERLRAANERSVADVARNQPQGLVLEPLPTEPAQQG